MIPVCLEKPLKAKYSYLRAVAAGQVYNQDTLILGLRRVITEFPEEPVAELARIYLSNFNTEVIASTIQATDTSAKVQEEIASLTQEKPTTSSPFVFSPEEMHYVILLVKTANLSVQTVKQNLNNFNNSYFSLQHFNISSFYINNTQQMVTVAKFTGKDNAMDYYNILLKNENFAPDIANGNIVVYPISATNYTTYYNRIAERPLYDDFLKEHYLKKGK
jgi:hypothetical protein